MFFHYIKQRLSNGYYHISVQLHICMHTVHLNNNYRFRNLLHYCYILTFTRLNTLQPFYIFSFSIYPFPRSEPLHFYPITLYTLKIDSGREIKVNAISV